MEIPWKILDLALFASTLRIATPILLASLGGVMSERSGVINIGLEGMMLAGAYLGFVVALYSDQYWLGLVASVGGGALLSVIVAWCLVRLGMVQIVVGISVLILAEGGISIL